MYCKNNLSLKALILLFWAIIFSRSNLINLITMCYGLLCLIKLNVNAINL